MPGVSYGPVKPTPLKRLGVKPVQQGGATGMGALKNITVAPGSRGGKVAAPSKPKMPKETIGRVAAPTVGSKLGMKKIKLKGGL